MCEVYIIMLTLHLWNVNHANNIDLQLLFTYSKHSLTIIASNIIIMHKTK